MIINYNVVIPGDETDRVRLDLERITRVRIPHDTLLEAKLREQGAKIEGVERKVEVSKLPGGEYYYSISDLAKVGGIHYTLGREKYSSGDLEKETTPSS